MFFGAGNKASATVQPFLLLHLDIHPDAVHTVEDVVCTSFVFYTWNILEGYCASTAGLVYISFNCFLFLLAIIFGINCLIFSQQAGVVTAKKSVEIQPLSKIMILHLMRFSYGSQGSKKLHKPVWFPLELVVNQELLVSPSGEVTLSLFTFLNDCIVLLCEAQNFHSEKMK